MTGQRWAYTLTGSGLRIQTPVRANSRPVVNELLGITGDVRKRLPCSASRQRCGQETVYSWELGRAGLFELFYVGSGAPRRSRYVLILGPPWSAFKVLQSEVLTILQRASRPVVEVVQEVLRDVDGFREIV
jgi:hypothetical protein